MTNLKLERLKAGLSQEQLASFAGLSQNGYSNIETGKCSVSLKHALQIFIAIHTAQDLNDLNSAIINCTLLDLCEMFGIDVCEIGKTAE